MQTQRSQKLVKDQTPSVCPMRISNQQVGIVSRNIPEWMQNNSKHFKLPPLHLSHNSAKHKTALQKLLGGYIEITSHIFTVG